MDQQRLAAGVAEAQWLASIDDVPDLMKYNAEAASYCTQSMTYKGKQYGLSYYGDHMSFVCNTDIMQRAGIDKPPATWDEVVQASLKIKQAGIVEYPCCSRSRSTPGSSSS